MGRGDPIRGHNSRDVFDSRCQVAWVCRYRSRLGLMGSADRREILQRDVGLEELYRDWEQIYRARLKDRLRRQEISARQPSKLTTGYLSADDFKKFHAAVSAANFSGSCLNAFLTINWHLLGSEVDGYELFKELRSRIRWWLHDHQVLACPRCDPRPMHLSGSPELLSREQHEVGKGETAQVISSPLSRAGSGEEGPLVLLQ